MFHLRAFVSERLSAAAVDIFGEVEKSLSLYQVEVSRSREEIILLRQQLELLRDNNTDPLKATRGTMLDHACILPVLQENDQGPPGTLGAPVDEEEELEDYSVGREFLPGPPEKTEHDVWTSCAMTQPNPEIPQIKEEQDEFSIAVGVGPSPDVVKSEPYDRDGAEREFTDRSLNPHDGDEEWVMGDERVCAENQKFDKLNVAKGLIDVGVTTSPPCEEDYKSGPDNDNSDVKWVMGDERRHLSTRNRKLKSKEKKSKAKSVSEDSTSETSCHFCGKSFQYRGSLMKHIKTHKAPREHVCTVCGKAFYRKDHLVSHARTHSGEKPYACEFCGKAFSQSQSLTIHRRCHTGEKPYECLACGKLFSTSSHLKIHMRCHADEKPYTCYVCGKQFRRSGQMTRHKRITHGGERLHGCTVCGVRYKYAPSLKAHLKTHENTSTNIADLQAHNADAGVLVVGFVDEPLDRWTQETNTLTG